ncbi:erythromycin esterase family protein [Nocardia carnea]|uniref:erythromycin esterase family protein n=1 Tax=Nocardia carnea TaxID=37328 RepID=UPI002456B60D|nr:erythromycin esterase family protein [Nocardia carnea]
MTFDTRTLGLGTAELLGFGEPTHLEPAFAWTRNDLFAELAGRFRSIALETDRVAALAVDDYVRHGTGTLESVMAVGFSHGFGELDANRQLVAWMREYNESRPAEERLAFHGFDAPLETMSAPSPRRYLEYVRDYLNLDRDLAGLAGPDGRWHRTEAVMDPAESPGASSAAETLRGCAEEMLIDLHTRAPELIATTSRADWFRAETHLRAGLGLLTYHKQAAWQAEQEVRWTRMCATRDALMAQNLLDIRRLESGRGATLVFAHNLHLQRNPSRMRMGDMNLDWYSAGAIVGSMVGSRYSVIIGSLGRDESIGLPEPATGTYESFLQSRVTGRDFIVPGELPAAARRTDHTPAHGYFPLDDATVQAADSVLHIHDGAVIRSSGRDDGPVERPANADRG